MISRDDFIKLISGDYVNSDEIICGMSSKRKTTFRLNRLKTNKEEVDKFLIENNISFTNPSFFSDAYILNDNIDLSEFDLYKEGKIYLQSLSSQIPPLFLDLENSRDILDMCAAPGGKTLEIASLTKNMKSIMACETNKIRAERLKHNLSEQGAKVNTIVCDSRKLDDFFRFDTILLDAPCSGSGTINLNRDKDLKNFSLDLVKNSAKVQKELLKKAITILKPGHTLVYSTCSILKVENEEVVKSVLNNNVVIEKINLDIDKSYLLDSKIDGVITVKPSELFEGFFIAKIKKLK